MTGAISEFDRREREDSARIPVCKFVIKLFKVVSLIFFEVEAEANPGGGAKPATYSHHPSYIHSPHTEQERWTVSSASKSSIRRFVITEKAPTRAFS